MARRSRLPIDETRRFATLHSAAHPRDFTGALAARFGVTRAGAAPTVRRLEAEGFLVRIAGGTRPTFVPGPSRLLTESATPPGIDESALWEQRFVPWLTLRPNVANTLHYAFTEMVNNANDHAAASGVAIGVMQTAETLYLSIRDDGIGVFRRIAQVLRLADERLAVLELAKGKFSSDPARHSGEGIFFTSRAADAFLLRANGLEYRRHAGAAWPALQRLGDLLPATVQHGTAIVLAMALDSERVLRDTFEAYTLGLPDRFDFDRTVVPVRLARVGAENLLSRSQAKRLTARLDRFRQVELDFSGVPEIGQAFADELFRVFVASNSQVDLRPSKLAPAVRAMIVRTGFALPD